jgi:hypothetical protein
VQAAALNLDAEIHQTTPVVAGHGSRREPPVDTFPEEYDGIECRVTSRSVHTRLSRCAARYFVGVERADKRTG